MNRHKKWMVTLDDSEYQWVRKTASELKMTGSAIIQELISRTMQAKERDFKSSLLQAQARIRRQELEEKKARIEAELQEMEAVTQKV